MAFLRSCLRLSFIMPLFSISMFHGQSEACSSTSDSDSHAVQSKPQN